MAWSITELENYNEGSSAAASKTTGSLSIPANSLVLVFAHASKDSSANNWGGDTITISDSVDGTTGWTGLDSLQFATGTAFAGGGQAFSKSFTSSSNRTITIARSAGTAFWGYSVLAITGQDTSNPIVQAKGTTTQWDDAGNSHTQSVTLSSAPTSGNAVITFLGCNNDSTAAATAPTGFTAINLPSAQFEAASSAYHTATTATTVTWPDCGDGIEYAVEFAIEVLAFGAGGDSGVSVAWIQA